MTLNNSTKPRSVLINQDNMQTKIEKTVYFSSLEL